MVDRTSYHGETIGIELPITVELVVETEPGFRRRHPTGAGSRRPPKRASWCTVPIFVEEGDTIRVDSRTGEYQTRVYHRSCVDPADHRSCTTARRAHGNRYQRPVRWAELTWRHLGRAGDQ